MGHNNETTNLFDNLIKAIDNANINLIDKKNIYDALAKYIENDTIILKNLNKSTWNADTKQ